MNRPADTASAAGAPSPPQVMLRGHSMNADLGQRPLLIDGADTVVKLFARRCAMLGDRTAHRKSISASGTPIAGATITSTRGRSGSA